MELDSYITSRPKSELRHVRADSHLALHAQVADRLRGLAAELGPGKRMPSEAELMGRLDVSRTTVRRAVKALTEAGVLDVQHGRGTFVAAHAVTQSVDEFRPFVESLATDGVRQSELVDSGWRTGWQVPASIGGPDLPGFGFRWLHRVDGRAHALFDCTLPVEIGQRIDPDQVASTPVYYLLEEIGVTPHAAEFSFTALAATDEIAKLLGVQVESSLLILDRTTIDVSGSIVETSRYHLVPELHRIRLSANAGNFASLLGFPGPHSDSA